LIDCYGEAWSEPDAARRTALLDAVWAPGATYTDPTVENLDRDGLLAHIARIQTTRPGARVRRSTAIDAHHEFARFGFEVIGVDGAVLRRGLDIAFLDASGTRLQRIIGFFGTLDAIR
jgi:hypothetical protein